MVDDRTKLKIETEAHNLMIESMHLIRKLLNGEITEASCQKRLSEIDIRMHNLAEQAWKEVNK